MNKKLQAEMKRQDMYKIFMSYIHNTQTELKDAMKAFEARYI